MSPIAPEFIERGRAAIDRCRRILHNDEFPEVTARQKASAALERTQAVTR